MFVGHLAAALAAKRLEPADHLTILDEPVLIQKIIEMVRMAQDGAGASQQAGAAVSVGR